MKICMDTYVLKGGDFLKSLIIESEFSFSYLCAYHVERIAMNSHGKQQRPSEGGQRMSSLFCYCAVMQIEDKKTKYLSENRFSGLSQVTNKDLKKLISMLGCAL